MTAKRLRIMHVQGPCQETGGAETFLRSLLHSQRSMGHEVGLLYSSARPDGRQGECDEFFLGSSYGLRTGRKLLQAYLDLLSSWKPDIVHLHVTYYHMSPLIVRNFLRRYPVLHTVHDTLAYCYKEFDGSQLHDRARILPGGIPCRRPVGSSCVRAGCARGVVRRKGWLHSLRRAWEVWYRVSTYRKIETVHVMSEFSRQDLVRNGFATKKLTVIPVSVPVPKPWLELGADVQSGGDEPVILYAGKFFAPKGIFLLLRALQKIDTARWKALFVGDGAEEQALKVAVSDMGLTSRIEIVPAVDRESLGDFYRRARLVVFPSMWPESLGWIGPEAMFFGKPVVAFDVGAVREWLTDGENGFLVQAGNIDGLADKMKLLLENRTLCQSMSDRARRAGVTFFSATTSTTNLTPLYQEAIGRRTRGPSD